jgi:hypothetical protein
LPAFLGTLADLDLILKKSPRSLLGTYKSTSRLPGTAGMVFLVAGD